MSDLRNQVYPENGLDPFPGEGRVVGRQRMHKPLDRMEHSGEPGPEAEPGGWGHWAGPALGGFLHHQPSLAVPPQAQAPNALPAGSRMTAEKFLNRLPKRARELQFMLLSPTWAQLLQALLTVPAGAAVPTSSPESPSQDPARNQGARV